MNYDIICKIFSYSTCQFDLLRFSQVCQLWREAACDILDNKVNDMCFHQGYNVVDVDDCDRKRIICHNHKYYWQYVSTCLIPVVFQSNWTSFGYFNDFNPTSKSFKFTFELNKFIWQMLRKTNTRNIKYEEKDRIMYLSSFTKIYDKDRKQIKLEDIHRKKFKARFIINIDAHLSTSNIYVAITILQMEIDYSIPVLDEYSFIEK